MSERHFTAILLMALGVAIGLMTHFSYGKNFRQEHDLQPASGRLTSVYRPAGKNKALEITISPESKIFLYQSLGAECGYVELELRKHIGEKLQLKYAEVKGYRHVYDLRGKDFVICSYQQISKMAAREERVGLLAAPVCFLIGLFFLLPISRRVFEYKFKVR